MLTHRRDFLKTSAYLSIGFSLLGCWWENGQPASGEALAGGELPDASRIDAWLQVLEDGDVRILTGKMELGQGLMVVMQQVAGEELNIPPHQIDVVIADTGRTQDEGYTAGSRSVERSAMIVRQAAAAARERLLALAAEQWKVPAEQLMLGEGRVNHPGKQQSLNFAQVLAGRQLSAELPDNVRLKPKDQYQWVGRPVPHPDLEKIVRGEPLYVQDLRFPNMVHARVVRPPVYGAKLRAWERALEQRPGILKVVENGSFLGIIGDDEYAVVKAWEEFREKAEWEAGPPLPDVTSWSEFLPTLSNGRPAETTRTADSLTHHAVYAKPYLMHGSIGPSCAVAFFQDRQLHVWSHTQGVYPLRSTLHHLTGLAEDRIRVTGVRGSGCYGHNGADDVAADAALLAMDFPGRHIRLQWQRYDEHQWEPYGSAMRMELQATLTPAGQISDWRYDFWSDSHSFRPRGDAGNFLVGPYMEQPFAQQAANSVGGGSRNSEPYYDIPRPHVQEHYVRGPLRPSALRSLGAYANIFAIECFMDELADKAGRDPLTFRLDHTSDERAAAVLRAMQALTKNVELKPGEGLGYGFSRYKNSASYCAVAARVFVDLARRVVRPVHLWGVIEAGETINPDGLKNQTEGGMIQAASWTLLEAVRFNAEGVLSKDWDTYPILRFDAAPTTEVVILDRPDLPPLGAGEAAQGPTGAAVANAVFRACGKRVRELPVVEGLFR